MFIEQVLHAVHAESSPAGIGKQNISITSLWFSQPGFEYSTSGLGQRCTALLASFADHSQVRAHPENEVFAFESCHLREAKSGLRGRQNKRVIAPTGPGAPIRGGE